MYSNETIIQILSFLDDNLYKKISIDEIASYFHYNKDYIMRLFKKEIGFTIIDYVNKRKIYNSLRAYPKNNQSILSISIQYGFSSQEYYCEIFHKIMGVSPSVFHSFKNFSKDISVEDVYKIQDNLSLLDFQFREIEKYRINVKPKSTVKILSVFK